MKGQGDRARSIGMAAALAVLLAGVASPPSTATAADLRPVVMAALDVPTPHAVQTRLGPRGQSRTQLVPHVNAPFPYDGIVPASGKPFLDAEAGGRRGRHATRGRIFWEDETYGDRRVLLHIPAGFDARRPGFIVVYFHGHGASLQSDVVARQKVPHQITASGTNAVLVAPQLAVNAPDSSIGKLWQAGGLSRLLDEAADNLGTMYGDPRAAAVFGRLPVVIVAYSGGYLAAAWSAQQGGIGKRLAGIVLLDALYGETDKFTEWLGANQRAFLVSAYTDTTRRRNEGLQQVLAAHNIAQSNVLDERLDRGVAVFIDAGRDASHRDFVTKAWTSAPISDVLARLPGYRPR